MAREDWRPDWDEVKDIMRPIEEKEGDETPQVDLTRLSDSERDWRARIEEEDRQQHIRERKARLWTRMSWSSRREERPEKTKKRQRQAPRSGRGGLAAQVVPYAAIFLLAPFVNNPAWFYLLVLATAAPLALAAYSLRPLGAGAWLFRMLAPVLPAQAWLALRYALWNPTGTLTLVSLCVLAGSFYYIAAVRDKGRREDRPKHEKPNRESTPVLELQDRRQVRRARGKDEKSANLAYGRRLLLFVTLLASVSLLVPAALGLGMELRRPSPNKMNEFEEASLHDDKLMARRMNGAYEQLQPEEWGRKDREGKRRALQALLDVETDSLALERFDLRDPAVYAAVSGAGHMGVPAALLSGKGKTQERVRAMCHLAYHLMQLTVSKDVSMYRFEDMAKGYENARYDKYVAQWALREPEVDHAGW